MQTHAVGCDVSSLRRACTREKFAMKAVKTPHIAKTPTQASSLRHTSIAAFCYDQQLTSTHTAPPRPAHHGLATPRST